MDRETEKELYQTIDKFKRMIIDIRQYATSLNYACKNFEIEMKYFLTDFIDIEEEEDTPCYVYYILNEDKSLVKIGISNNVKSRISNMQTSTGYYLELLHDIKFPSRQDAMKAEHFLHLQFSEHRRKPSKINKSSEWFDACIIDTLKKLYWKKENIDKLMEYHNKQVREEMEKCKILC